MEKPGLACCESRAFALRSGRAEIFWAGINNPRIAFLDPHVEVTPAPQEGIGGTDPDLPAAVRPINDLEVLQYVVMPHNDVICRFAPGEL
jgi:hypothetical protein